MSEPAPARADVRADVRRVSERLRSAPPARVAAAATATRSALQQLADAEHGIRARTDAAAPTWHEVPTLIDTALGDQLAVLGADLVGAITGIEDAEPVWTRDGRRPLGEVVSSVAATLKELRLAL